MNPPSSVGSGFASNSATTVTITGVTAAVGDLLIVDAGNDGGHVPTAVSDSGGNSYSADLVGQISAGNWAQGRFSCVVAAALSSGTITVTFTGISGVWDKWAAAVKVTPAGSWDSSRVDKTAKSTGTGAAWTSTATAATTEAAELVYGCAVMGKGGSGTVVSDTPGSGFTEVFDTNASNWVAYTTEYKIVAAVGAQTATGTWAGLTTRPWGGYVVTYKEAAAGTTVEGAATLALVFGAATAGTRRANASATVAVSASIASAAKKTAHASASLRLTLSPETAARRAAKAAASLPLTLDLLSAGKKVARAAASLPLTLTITTSGISGTVVTVAATSAVAATVTRSGQALINPAAIAATSLTNAALTFRRAVTPAAVNATSTVQAAVTGGVSAASAALLGEDLATLIALTL